MGRTIVAMIIAEGWTEGSCAGGSSLGVRAAGTKFYNEVSRWGIWSRAFGGLELAESSSVNETPGAIPHWVGCSSCSSLSFRNNVRWIEGYKLLQVLGVPWVGQPLE